MRCTECSAEVKPIVAVDIDGTLGHYYSHFMQFAESYLGHPLKKGYHGGQEWSDYLGLDKELYRDIKLAYRQGGMKRSMPAYSNASAFMYRIREMGYEVWIATTRPYLRLDNIDPDTQEWFRRNDIQYDYMLYGEDKYQQLGERVDKERVVAVIEDLYEQCVLAANVFPENHVWQIERPHNIDEPWGYHFDSFVWMTEYLRLKKGTWDDGQGRVVESVSGPGEREVRPPQAQA